MKSEVPVKIALVTEHRYESPDERSPYIGNILFEDQLLSDALQRFGIETERVDWARNDVDWSTYEAAVLRTTWDYFDRFVAFQAWLDAVDARTTLLNPLELIRWNIDKHYLLELESRGISIVPTLIVERGDHSHTLASIATQAGWQDVIIKPTVSGAARDTHLIHAAELETSEPLFHGLVDQKTMMVQPFLHEVLKEGEVTIVVIDGTPTHAIRKRARPGDFRVQDDYGGTVHSHEPTAAELELAIQTFATITPTPVYGRIDMITDRRQTPRVMEVEIIEPELWLRFHPVAAKRFARALAMRLHLADGD